MKVNWELRLIVALFSFAGIFNSKWSGVSGFSTSPPTFTRSCDTSKSLVSLGITRRNGNDEMNLSYIRELSISTIFAFSLIFSFPQISTASEIGVEVEAPTFITGETVEICTKRGPLGACLKTERRTESNDNDIAKKYFKEPSELGKQREAAMRAESDEGNSLIQKLKQQSVENADKNKLLVDRKTFENNQAATFGPFDRQVLIMNTDGKTFTLLQNPQAMRLKKAGFIDGRRQFIKQPTQEEIDQALESEGFFAGLLGGS